jgi:hypothetical protein
MGIGFELRMELRRALPEGGGLYAVAAYALLVPPQFAAKSFPLSFPSRFKGSRSTGAKLGLWGLEVVSAYVLLIRIFSSFYPSAREYGRILRRLRPDRCLIRFVGDS